MRTQIFKTWRKLSWQINSIWLIREQEVLSITVCAVWETHLNTGAGFINCSSLFSRFVTKCASEGQRQQFCQLPPLSVQYLCISGTQTETDYNQNCVPWKWEAQLFMNTLTQRSLHTTQPTVVCRKGTMNFHRKRKDCEPTSWATKPGTKSIWHVLRNQKQWLMWDFPLDPLGLLLQVTRHLPTSATSCIGGGRGGRVTNTPAYKCQGHRWRFLALFNVSWQTYIPLPPALPTAGNVSDSGPLLPSDIILVS